MLKKIALEKFGELVAALMGKGKLFAPVKGNGGVNFEEIKNAGDVTLDFYNTVMSPKSIFFPQTEDMVKYRIGKDSTDSEIVPPAAGPQILLGVRPCDVRSFEIMDLLFEDSGIIDPYWVERRKSTTVIGFAFDSVDPVDFYNTFGIHAADPRGSDVFMIKTDRGILLKGMTEKGEKLLEELPVLADASADDAEAFEAGIAKGPELKTRFLDLKGVDAKLLEIFDTPYWHKVSAACLSCGTCTFVCPTCHCFDICDENIFREGRRCRTWDACMFTNFTLETSGHNPRTRIFQRLRQKVNHKFSYYVSKFGATLCVGCGRCTRSCPVNIDIFSIVEGAKKVQGSEK
ncbi:MAG: Anaerobic sulfite reductase subunit A [Syntrophaceae bacterium PtaU1.Bin231]|nr:MAG: Anaerobic sulfite reductase subunit A [Syntrophaceae bacterium PtaU1.Bin231]